MQFSLSCEATFFLSLGGDLPLWEPLRSQVCFCVLDPASSWAPDGYADAAKAPFEAKLPEQWGLDPVDPGSSCPPPGQGLVLSTGLKPKYMLPLILVTGVSLSCSSGDSWSRGEHVHIWPANQEP